MRLIERLTPQQRVQILGNNTVGIFDNLFTSTDKMYDDRFVMCKSYYLAYSGGKEISPLYETYIKMLDDVVGADPPEKYLAEYIRAKYINKWNKLYDTLYNSDYDPIYNIQKDVTVIDDNTEVTTYNSTVENDGNTSVKETVTTGGSSEQGVYGFNSATSVGTNTDTNSMTETTEGDSEHNTSYNKQDKSGDDTLDVDNKRTITENSRTVSAKELITDEVELKKINIFDIIYKDIDSVVVTDIYFN